MPDPWKTTDDRGLRNYGGSMNRRDFVKSLAGEPCRLRTLLTGTVRATSLNGTGKPLGTLAVEVSADGTVILAFKKGETALLYDGDTMSQAVIAPVARRYGEMQLLRSKEINEKGFSNETIYSCVHDHADGECLYTSRS